MVRHARFHDARRRCCCCTTILGNVRELEKLVERGAAVARGPLITLEDGPTVGGGPLVAGEPQLAGRLARPLDHAMREWRILVTRELPIESGDA